MDHLVPALQASSCHAQVITRKRIDLELDAEDGTLQQIDIAKGRISQFKLVFDYSRPQIGCLAVQTRSKAVGGTGTRVAAPG